MAAMWSVKFEGLTRVTGNIQKLMLQAPQEAAKVLRTSATAVVVPEVKNNIRKGRHVLTGEYHARQTARSGIRGGQPFVEIGALGVPYGRNIEEGAPPHTPNEARIKEYVRKKMGLNGPRADAVAATIIQTIRTSGTKPHPTIMPAWRATSSRFFADFVARMKIRLAAISGGGP